MLPELRSDDVEKQARKAMRRMAFWRFVAEGVMAPAYLAHALYVVINNVLVNVSKPLNYLEYEAARRYIALTGHDLAYAIGDTDRYTGLDPIRLSVLREFQTRRLSAGLEHLGEYDEGEE